MKKQNAAPILLAVTIASILCMVITVLVKP